MYINAKMNIAKDFKVLDLNTGEFKDHVTEANDEGIKWYKIILIKSDKCLERCEKCDEIFHKRIESNIKLVYDPQ